MILFIFPFLSVFSQLVVVGAVIYSRKQLFGELRVLAAYFVVCLIVVTVQLFLAIYAINNLWASQVFSPIQFVMLMYVFYFWNRQSKAGKIMLYSIPAFVAGWCLGTIWLGGMAGIYTYMDPISAAIFVLTSSYTLLTIERVEGSSVLALPPFWISSATVIYFGSTIVLSSLNASLLKTSVSTMQLAWSMQAVINILANLLYAGGFLCLRQKT